MEGLAATFDLAAFGKDMIAPVNKIFRSLENRNEHAPNAKDHFEP